MKAGRGRPAPPHPTSEEERWLQMAESALFYFRLVLGKLPDEHEIFNDGEWYDDVYDYPPSDNQLIRMCNELAVLCELDTNSGTWDRLYDARRRHAEYYDLNKRDVHRLLEELVERTYERREAE